MLVGSCWITLQDMLLLLPLYHIAVNELLIPVLNIDFTVVIFLYFLQKIWTLHVLTCFWVLFLAPLLLPVSQFLFSRHLCLSQYMQLQLPSCPPALIPLLRWSWAGCLYWCFYSVIVTMFEQWNESFDRHCYVLIKLSHYFVKDNIQPIKTTLDFELVKLLEFNFFLFLDFLVLSKRFCFYNTISKTIYR